MSWVDNITALATAAVNAVGTTSGASAVSALESAITGNKAYAQAAAAQMATLQVAFASSPPNVMSASFAMQTLQSMLINGQIPAAIGPQLTLLQNPAVQLNPVAVAQAISAINSLLNH